METFVITFSAKPGAEDKVSAFYISQQAEYQNAKGFRGRQILRAKSGTMVAAVKQRLSAEEMAKHPEQHHGDGSQPTVHFVIVEQWDSVDDRMDFSMSRDRTPDKELFPHLLPEHTHEFYSNIAPV